MNQDSKNNNQEEIDKCISTLSNLLEDTNQLFDLSREKREELMTLAGKLSRPNKEEFETRKKILEFYREIEGLFN